MTDNGSRILAALLNDSPKVGDVVCGCYPSEEYVVVGGLEVDDYGNTFVTVFSLLGRDVGPFYRPLRYAQVLRRATDEEMRLAGGAS